MFDEFGPRGAEDEREGFWTDLSEVPDEQYRDEEVYLIMAAASDTFPRGGRYVHSQEPYGPGIVPPEEI